MLRALRSYLSVVALVACAPSVPPESAPRTVVDLSCGLNFPIYLAVGDTAHLRAATTEVNYDVLTCLDSMVPGHHWHSTSSTIVSVDSEGFARALRPGHVELNTETSFGPARGAVIVLPALSRFGFGQDSVVIPVGTYTEMSVDPQDSAGEHLYPEVQFNWGRGHALGGLTGGGGPNVSVEPSHSGRAYLVARMSFRADTVLVIARAAVPSAIADSAAVPVRRILGDSLFRVATTLQPELTEFDPSSTSGCGAKTCPWPWQNPYYVVFFRFHPTGDERRDGLIAVVVDSNGSAIPGFAPSGAPACATTPTLCDFRISRDSAIVIARASGFPAGNKPWDVWFLWTARENVRFCPPCAEHFDWGPPIEPARYAWRIDATLTGGEHGPWTGETLWIDATTGMVLKKSPWRAE